MHRLRGVPASVASMPPDVKAPTLGDQVSSWHAACGSRPCVAKAPMPSGPPLAAPTRAPPKRFRALSASTLARHMCVSPTAGVAPPVREMRSAMRPAARLDRVHAGHASFGGEGGTLRIGSLHAPPPRRPRFDSRPRASPPNSAEGEGLRWGPRHRAGESRALESCPLPDGLRPRRAHCGSAGRHRDGRARAATTKPPLRSKRDSPVHPAPSSESASP